MMPAGTGRASLDLAYKMVDTILKQTKSDRDSFFARRGQLLQELAREGQKPYALFVGCADARIMPEQFLGPSPGDLFMLRNIANLIPPYWQTEIAISSLLEFCIFELQVAHIIVCGHTQCGGILALDNESDIVGRPGLSRWLELARPAKREVDVSRSAVQPGERHKRIVERNVVHQLDNLLSYPYVRQLHDDGRLTLHGWVFYLELPGIGYYSQDTDAFLIS
jgi:carbonic anhydrase